jgi:cytochrome c553
MIFAMRILTTLVLTLALLATAAYAQQADRDHGAEILEPFKQNLQQALREGLSKGPVQALSACQIEAPKIAEGLSQDGIRVGRTSDRLRNPANRSPGWVRPILEEYLANPSLRTSRSLPLAEGRTGYVEPILMQSLCLTCHGASLDAKVASEIKRLYPEDEAVGFDVGELRGVFWVEFPTTGEMP